MAGLMSDVESDAPPQSERRPATGGITSPLLLGSPHGLVVEVDDELKGRAARVASVCLYSSTAWASLRGFRERAIGRQRPLLLRARQPRRGALAGRPSPFVWTRPRGAARNGAVRATRRTCRNRFPRNGPRNRHAWRNFPAQPARPGEPFDSGAILRISQRKRPEGGVPPPGGGRKENQDGEGGPTDRRPVMRLPAGSGPDDWGGARGGRSGITAT
jgi:hypothetical protein